MKKLTGSSPNEIYALRNTVFQDYVGPGENLLTTETYSATYGLERQDYLLTDGSRHGDGEWSDVAAPQVLPLSLIAEELEFPFLFLIQ